MERTYAVGFKGKIVKLFDEQGRTVRSFIARSEVVNAQVTTRNRNPIVAITTKDGKFELYNADGTTIRKS
jgi:CRISPR type I-A-associated protein Csa5